jgi:hypothetical protein
MTGLVAPTEVLPITATGSGQFMAQFTEVLGDMGIGMCPAGVSFASVPPIPLYAPPRDAKFDAHAYMQAVATSPYANSAYATQVGHFLVVEGEALRTYEDSYRHRGVGEAALALGEAFGRSGATFKNAVIADQLVQRWRGELFEASKRWESGDLRLALARGDAALINDALHATWGSNGKALAAARHEGLSAIDAIARAYGLEEDERFAPVLEGVRSFLVMAKTITENLRDKVRQLEASGELYSAAMMQGIIARITYEVGEYDLSFDSVGRGRGRMLKVLGGSDEFSETEAQSEILRKAFLRDAAGFVPVALPHVLSIMYDNGDFDIAGEVLEASARYYLANGAPEIALSDHLRTLYTSLMIEEGGRYFTGSWNTEAAKIARAIEIGREAGIDENIVAQLEELRLAAIRLGEARARGDVEEG